MPGELLRCSPQSKITHPPPKTKIAPENHPPIPTPKDENRTRKSITKSFTNPTRYGIAEALVYMHEVENWGGGVTRYYVRCAELSLPPPLVEERGGCLSVTFYRPDVVNGVVNVVNDVNSVANPKVGQNASADAIIGLIRQDSRISAAKIAQSLGMVDRTVQRIMKTLQTKGLLRRVGGTRGHWEVMS